MNRLSHRPYVSKRYFCWLALLVGFVGGHWLYVCRKKRFWIYLLMFPLSWLGGWFDVIRYGLMKDEQFNVLFNPNCTVNIQQTSGDVVLAVVLSLTVSVTLLVAILAMVFQWYFSGVLA